MNEFEIQMLEEIELHFTRYRNYELEKVAKEFSKRFYRIELYGEDYENAIKSKWNKRKLERIIPNKPVEKQKKVKI